MRVRTIVLVAALAFPTVSKAEELFDYDASAELGVKIVGTERRSWAYLRHLTYPSPKGGLVTGTLVTAWTNAPGARFATGPATLYMHWGLGDRHAFLDEAMESGRPALLIDAPWLRPDAPKLSEADQVIQTVIDLRRGVDVLMNNGADKVVYTGLSYGSWVGAILAAVEPRISGFALAGGLASNSEATSDQSIAHLDAEKWIGKATAPVFLQFALRDEYITREQADRYDRAAPRVHITKWYEGGHEFNAAARRDRLSWLRSLLRGTPSDTYQPVDLPEESISTFGAYGEIAKQGVVIEIPGMQHARVKRDVAWKEGMRLDVYYPPAPLAEEDRLPAIISLAGQAPPDFMRVVRSMRFSTTFAQALATRCNRVVIVPDIRAAATGAEPRQRNEKLPQVAADIDDLVAWVREHAEELQIDGEQLAMVFRSAGWSYGFRTSLRNAPPYIKAVVAYYPLLAQNPLAESGLPQEFRDEISIDKLLAAGKPLPPILLVTAQYDFWYSEADTKRVLAAAAAANANVRHIHLPNSGHAFELDADLEESRDALRQTMLFLRENLKVR